MIVRRCVSVDLDVTPQNWPGIVGGGYFTAARVVHEWIANGSTPEMLGDMRAFGLAELQAVTVSVQKPNVVFRMCMPDGRSVAEVAEFADKARLSLAEEFKRAGIGYERGAREGSFNVAAAAPQFVTLTGK